MSLEFEIEDSKKSFYLEDDEFGTFIITSFDSGERQRFNLSFKEAYLFRINSNEFNEYWKILSTKEAEKYPKEIENLRKELYQFVDAQYQYREIISKNGRQTKTLCYLVSNSSVPDYSEIGEIVYENSF